jgi:hypothetical protein
MPSVQVKNVPPEVHAELTRRAKRKGISLQDYVLQLLVEDADTVPLDELFDAIERGEGGRTGGSISLQDTLDALDEGRASRDRR